MDLIWACANHMNPPLSYIDPSNVGSMEVFSGTTPVRSAGGDSIGGAIVVKSAPPEFAKPGEGTLAKGQVGAFFRSNGNGKGGNVSVTVASDTLSLRYDGSTPRPATTRRRRISSPWEWPLALTKMCHSTAIEWVHPATSQSTSRLAWRCATSIA